jgi:hypothetical protein
MSVIELTPHSLAADLVETIIISGLIDVRLIWVVNHTYVASFVDEEAELFEVCWERRIRHHSVFYTSEHFG